jgi:DNA polymerase III subunit epsilon
MSGLGGLDKFITLDVETTGTDPLEARAVELGLCEFVIDQTGQIAKLKPWAKLLNPTVPVGKGATGVHGITDAHVKDKPRFRESAEKFSQFLRGKIVVGYNFFAFDGPLLKAEFARAGIARPFDGVVIVDVYPYIREDYGSKRRPQSKSLNDQCAWWGVALPKAHSAAHDAEATGRLALAMQAWPGRKPTMPYELEQILEDQRRLREELDRPVQVEIDL